MIFMMKSRVSKLNIGIVSVGLAVALILPVLLLACSEPGPTPTPDVIGEALERGVRAHNRADALGEPTPTMDKVGSAFATAFAPRTKTPEEERQEAREWAEYLDFPTSTVSGTICMGVQWRSREKRPL